MSDFEKAMVRQCYECNATIQDLADDWQVSESIIRAILSETPPPTRYGVLSAPANRQYTQAWAPT